MKMTPRTTDQAADIVISQFEHQLDLYSEHSSVEISKVVPFLSKYLKKNPPKKTFKICEFGGGGGNLLQAIQKKSKAKLELHNVELVEMYGKVQVMKSIHFSQGSVLDPQFNDETFDVVIVRNVLHHLVSPSLTITRKNQQQAIRQLDRVTKPGGLILVEEQVNNNSLACSTFFHLSWLATKLKLNIKAFQITPSTIVGYMSRKQLKQICANVVPANYWLEDEYQHWPPELHWKMTGLMNDTGSAFIAMQKPAATSLRKETKRSKRAKS